TDEEQGNREATHMPRASCNGLARARCNRFAGLADRSRHRRCRTQRLAPRHAGSCKHAHARYHLRVLTLEGLETALLARWGREEMTVYADYLQSIGDPRGEVI